MTKGRYYNLERARGATLISVVDALASGSIPPRRATLTIKSSISGAQAINDVLPNSVGGMASETDWSQCASKRWSKEQ